MKVGAVPRFVRDIGHWIKRRGEVGFNNRNSNLIFSKPHRIVVLLYYYGGVRRPHFCCAMGQDPEGSLDLRNSARHSGLCQAQGIHGSTGGATWTQDSGRLCGSLLPVLFVVHGSGKDGFGESVAPSLVVDKDGPKPIPSLNNCSQSALSAAV